MKKDKEGKDYLSFILTSDPTDTETENVKFFVRVEDPKLIVFATHLRSKMKVIVCGEYQDEVSFILGTLLTSSTIHPASLHTQTSQVEQRPDGFLLVRKE